MALVEEGFAASVLANLSLYRCFNYIYYQGDEKLGLFFYLTIVIGFSLIYYGYVKKTERDIKMKELDLEAKKVELEMKKLEYRQYSSEIEEK